MRDSTNVRRTKLIPAGKIVAHENSARETHVFVSGKYQEDGGKARHQRLNYVDDFALVAQM